MSVDVVRTIIATKIEDWLLCDHECETVQELCDKITLDILITLNDNNFQIVPKEEPVE